MKELWVDVRPWRKDLATTAIESGADVLVVDEASKVRVLGRIRTVAPDGDLVPGKEVFFIEIKGKEGEVEAVERSRQGIVVVSTSDWTVIPLENLVAQSDRIIAEVKTPEQAEVALHVLEKGVHGILLSTSDPAIIRQVAASMKSGLGCTGMVPFTVTAVRPLGMGDRVCVDTCSLLSDGDGMLVGNTSSGFLLVHAETLENPYVAPRPFRVNAGAVHAYIMLPDGKTAYLSDLKSGDHVVVADAVGVHEGCDRGKGQDREAPAPPRGGRGRRVEGEPRAPERGDDTSRERGRERPVCRRSRVRGQDNGQACRERASLRHRSEGAYP